MAKINLKDFYPFYEKDLYIEVSNEVAETLAGFDRAEESYKRKLRRNKAYYSLDREDGIEKEITTTPITPEEAYNQKSASEKLYSAIAALPSKQAKRIYAHYLLGISKTQIAKTEGVHWSSINRCLRLGLSQIKKIIENT